MTMKEWGPWVNRLGILLTFAAGFLAAPTLLGAKRLKSWEARARRLATRVMGGYPGMAEMLENRGNTPLLVPKMIGLRSEPSMENADRALLYFGSIALVHIAASAMFWGFATAAVVRSRFWILGSVADFLGLFLWARAAAKYLDPPEARIALQRSARRSLHILPLGLIEGSLFLIVLGIAFILARWATAFSERGRLKSYLIPLGVGTFILGNLLQLVATFL